MDDTQQKDFEQVNTTILEDWGLMMIEPAGSVSDSFNPFEIVYVSSIRFSGPNNGIYRVCCQADFMNALAQNLLGELDDVSLSDQEDALKEMANVVCGNLLTALYGSDKTFDLSQPLVEERKVADLEKMNGEGRAVFLADDCPVLVSLEAEQK